MIIQSGFTGQFHNRLQQSSIEQRPSSGSHRQHAVWQRQWRQFRRKQLCAGSFQKTIQKHPDFGTVQNVQFTTSLHNSFRGFQIRMDQNHSSVGCLNFRHSQVKLLWKKDKTKLTNLNTHFGMLKTNNNIKNKI